MRTRVRSVICIADERGGSMSMTLVLPHTSCRGSPASRMAHQRFMLDAHVVHHGLGSHVGSTAETVVAQKLRMRTNAGTRLLRARAITLLVQRSLRDCWMKVDFASDTRSQTMSSVLESIGHSNIGAQILSHSANERRSPTAACLIHVRIVSSQRLLTHSTAACGTLEHWASSAQFALRSREAHR